MKNFGTITARSSVIFERYLPGPIERVWSYLTNPRYLAKWFDEGSIAGHVGGSVRFEMGVEGRVTAYDPPHLLEYTWKEDDAPGGPIANAVVRWELAKEGDRVHLTLTHARLPEYSLVSHGAGWHTFLERLSACLEDREPPPIKETYSRLEAEYNNYFRMEQSNGKR